MYDFFKTSFPGQMSIEMDGTFSDDLTVKASCTLSYVKDCLICRLFIDSIQSLIHIDVVLMHMVETLSMVSAICFRCQVHFENLSEESPAASEDMSATLPCFEVLDKGEKADECKSTIDLVRFKLQILFSINIHHLPFCLYLTTTCLFVHI